MPPPTQTSPSARPSLLQGWALGLLACWDPGQLELPPWSRGVLSWDAHHRDSQWPSSRLGVHEDISSILNSESRTSETCSPVPPPLPPPSTIHPLTHPSIRPFTVSVRVSVMFTAHVEEEREFIACGKSREACGANACTPAVPCRALRGLGWPEGADEGACHVSGAPLPLIPGHCRCCAEPRGPGSNNISRA